MIDSKLRAPFQKWLVDPLLRQKGIFKLHPISVSCAALGFGVICAIFIALQKPWIAFLCLAISGYLDVLDGSIARYTKRVSHQGAILDIFFDRCVEFSLILGLYFYAPIERALYSLLMVGSILLCITSFLVVGIFEHNESEKSFHYSVGIMERSEAFLFFGAMILFPSFFPYLGSAFALLVFITALVRIIQSTR